MALSKPPTAEKNPQHLSESHRLVRERSFSIEQNLLGILDSLRHSKSTGQLCIDLSQGGIGSIRFREEQKLKFEEDEKSP